MQATGPGGFSRPLQITKERAPRLGNAARAGVARLLEPVLTPVATMTAQGRTEPEAQGPTSTTYENLDAAS